MRVLPLHLIRQIKNFDRSIDVLWNDRINRWCVVQELPKPRRVSNELRGVSSIAGEYSCYKFLFTCEMDKPRWPDDPTRGYPIEPGNWITEFIARSFPTKQETYDPENPDRDRLAKSERAADEQVAKEKKLRLDAISSASKADLRDYGGLGRYSSEGAIKRHIILG